MQCMKCHWWGHFANNCTAKVNTCRTRSGDHWTNKCNNRGTLHCVSCKSDVHASWDRECPKFHRRCNQHDENYLENNLLYFPSSKDWTLMPCPCKFQHAEKYPLKYAVISLHPPEQNNCAPMARPQGKQKRPRGNKVPNSQSTMECFIGPGGPTRSGKGMLTDTHNADTAATPSLDPTHYCTPNFGQEPHRW